MLGSIRAGLRRLSMATAIPPRSVAVGKAEHAWRGRIALACGVLAACVVGVGAFSLDWSQGAAMALGQLAGMVAPVAALGAAVWAAAAMAGRRR
jgi:hypothetical protein